MVRLPLHTLFTLCLVCLNVITGMAQVTDSNKHSVLVLDTTPSYVLDGIFSEENPMRRATTPLSIDLNNAVYIFDDIKTNSQEDALANLPWWPSFDDYVQSARDTSIKLTDKQKDFIARIQYYRKYYRSAPITFNECIFFNPAYKGADYILSHRYKKPEALRFYSTPISDTIIADDYTMKLNLNKPLSSILSPFYFKKTAITNKEYREFVNWVRDSIVRTMLYNAGDNSMVLDTAKDPPVLNWKTPIRLDQSDVQENVADLYLPAMERFYRRREWDARKFNYVYYFNYPPRKEYLTVPGYDYLNGWITDSIGKVLINVYPDTMAWVHDFIYSFNEPMANMYFWHPSFDDYPVVGISKKQAEAFLNWKSDQEQKKLNKEGKGEWIVKYELPTEYEWEMVESADVKSGQPSIYPDYAETMNDKSYITDLLLKPDKTSIPISFNDKRDSVPLSYGMDSIGHFEADKSKKNWMRNSVISAYASQGFCFSWNLRRSHDDEVNENKPRNKRIYEDQVLKADFEKNYDYIKQSPILSLNYDCNHISFMGGNVSEWMQETYTKNYKPVYDYRHELLKK